MARGEVVALAREDDDTNTIVFGGAAERVVELFDKHAALGIPVLRAREDQFCDAPVLLVSDLCVLHGMRRLPSVV
jgi:hypothetical protein